MRAFRIAYDGADYRGFQRQPSVSTVEDELLDALESLDVLDRDEGPPPGYAAAGRTDAGVSALAQTIAFETPEWLTPAALNGALPGDIRAWASAPVPDGFHATHQADAREYEYHLSAPAADEDRARAVIDRLAGTHDVSNLTLDEKGTERTLEPTVDVEDSFLVVRFRAGGFPRQFVRRAVELVREVATGEASIENVDRVLDPTPLPGPDGVPPAPPRPLVLIDVSYPDVAFTVDPDAVESARGVFGRKRTEWRTRARVANRIASGVAAGECALDTRRVEKD
jgi:tRNA pseudouridine38-40 synthase